jgi:predicted site-specific integrase-resolvase
MEDVFRRLGMHEIDDAWKKKKKFVYCRVSSSHQKEDLQRQIQDLSSEYPEHTVISDIGSGLNFKRKGLLAILDKTLDGLVEEIVIMHKDRLCRYGIEILEFIFKKFGTKLVVFGRESEINDTRELADDLLAITTIFVARHNGRRSAINRRRRKEQSKSNQDSTVSN